MNLARTRSPKQRKKAHLNARDGCHTQPGGKNENRGGHAGGQASSDSSLIIHHLGL